MKTLVLAIVMAVFFVVGYGAVLGLICLRDGLKHGWWTSRDTPVLAWSVFMTLLLGWLIIKLLSMG